MASNPYEPPDSKSSNPTNPLRDAEGRLLLSSPAVLHTARDNLEAHALVVMLDSYDIPAFAVEDNSAVPFSMYGVLSQIHKPKIYVDEVNLAVACELLQQFRQQQEQKKAARKGGTPIESTCEECGATSTFPPEQDGTTQSCPECYAFMDVGTFEWPEGVDVEGTAAAEGKEPTAEDDLDAALKLERAGDWQEAMDAYRAVADQWPEYAIYANNCIASIQRKING